MASNKSKKKQKEQKDHAPVQNASRRLWIYMFVVVIFYSLMFTSKYYIPPKSYAYNIGPEKFGDQSYLVTGWRWAQDSRKMEVVVSVDNVYIEPEEISVSLAMTSNRKETTVHGDVVIKRNDLIVILFDGVEKEYSEFRIHMYFPKNDIQFANNINQVELVEEITEKTETEYLIDAKQGMAAYYQSVIEEAEAQIAENETQIEEYNLEISRIREREAYMTEAQLSSAAGQIKTQEYSIERLRSDIEKTKEEIEEYKLRIENLNKEIENIRSQTE